MTMDFIQELPPTGSLIAKYKKTEENNKNERN